MILPVAAIALVMLTIMALKAGRPEPKRIPVRIREDRRR